MRQWQIITVVIITAIAVVATGLVLFQNESPRNNRYVAMGDSVAAGVGIGAAMEQACGRAESAYPHKIADELDLTLTNLACSGATLSAGILDTQPGTTNSQLGALFALERPDVVTMTIGANDARAGWHY